MLETIGVTILSVAAFRLMEIFLQVRSERERTWKEGDNIPDALD